MESIELNIGVHVCSIWHDGKVRMQSLRVYGDCVSDILAGMFASVAEKLWECDSESHCRQWLCTVAVHDGFIQYLICRDIQVLRKLVSCMLVVPPLL